jgi:8-oxo-dGTP pyrophosphatase MutT (NUDIX family)
VKNEDLLSTDLALKIAAIKEIFEETGIELREKIIKMDFAINLRMAQNLLVNSECVKLKIRPNIESLIEWSN